MKLNDMVIEVETSGMGTLVVIDDKKTFTSYSSREYPITDKIAHSLATLAAKEISKKLVEGKASSTVVTMYGRSFTFDIVNLVRFTFETISGEVLVQYRPFDGEGFPISVEKTFAEIKDVRKYLINIFESYIYEYIDVLDNSQNYFTR